MNHDQIKNQLEAYYDKELPGRERAKIDQHLTGCAECREQLETWQQASAVLFQNRRTEPSEIFVTRVMARLTEPRQSWVRRFLPQLWPVPVWGAGLATFIFAMTELSNGSATDILLLDEPSKDHAMEWVLERETSQPNNLLELALEAQ